MWAQLCWVMHWIGFRSGSIVASLSDRCCCDNDPVERLAVGVASGVDRATDASGDGCKEGVERNEQQRAVDSAVKPVELVFGFPTKVKAIGSAGQKGTLTQQGPAPDLTSLTLTVPWMCV